MNFIKFLNTVPEFSEFKQRELETLEKAMSVNNYNDAHVFIEEGKRAHIMYLIIEGEVIVSRRHYQERGIYELERLGPGDLFGLVSLIDHGRRTATCTAQGPVTIATLPRSAFELLFYAQAPIALHFQKLIVHQLANDMRIYTQVMVDSIKSGNTENMLWSLGGVSYEYRGSERRKLERRNSETSSDYRGPERRKLDRREAPDSPPPS